MSAAQSGSPSDDNNASYGKPTNVADKNPQNQPPTQLESNTNDDFFTSLKRLADGQISAALHSIFGIPTSLQPSNNWIMERHPDDHPVRAEIERQRSTALRKGSSDGDDESGGSTPSIGSNSGSSSAPPAAPSDTSKSQREQMQSFLIQSIGALGLIPALLALDQEVEKQRKEWTSLARKEWERSNTNRTAPTTANPVTEMWRDVFGREGQSFYNFAEEMFGEEAFGASQRRRTERVENEEEQNDDVKMQRQPCIPFSETEFKSLTRNKDISPDFLRLLQSQVSVMRDAGWLCKDTSPAPHMVVPIYTLPVQTLPPAYREVETELDLYDLHAERTENQRLEHPASEKVVVSSMTSTSTRTSTDGVTKTRCIRERRYSDGSVERIEEDDEAHSSGSIEGGEQEGWQGWGEYGYPKGLGGKRDEMRRAFEEERKRLGEAETEKSGKSQSGSEEGKSGWFWASGKE